MKKIYYWAPHLVHIATPRAVINSAYSLQKFSKKFEIHIINFFGEFNLYKEELITKKINLINFYNKLLIKYLPKYGFIKSRFSFLIFFTLGFIPLKNLIKKNNPDFLIIHLITSLPLFLLILFSFKTKLILRISGKPRLNFLRKFFWKIAFKKIYKITCPTLSTLNYIKKLNIVKDEKLFLLYDPIININEFNKQKNLKPNINFNHKNFFFAAGRLTLQKNFLFLCRCFQKILKKNNSFKLVIAGEGEDKNKIISFINRNNLNDNIFLIGNVDNIFYFLRNSKFFILSSFWEDPGFVLMEAAISRAPIISSDCDTGPKELIKDKFNGILFFTNDQDDFIKKLNFGLQLNDKEIHKIKLSNLKLAKKFTIFSHFNQLTHILD